MIASIPHANLAFILQHPPPHSLCCIYAEGTSKLEGSMLKLEHYHGRWPGNAYGDDDRRQMYHICVIEKVLHVCIHVRK